MNNGGPIRLACYECDRDDCDGIDAIPAGWRDVEADSTLADWRLGDGAWWTHVGLCPECAASEDEENRKIAARKPQKELFP